MMEVAIRRRAIP